MARHLKALRGAGGRRGAVTNWGKANGARRLPQHPKKQLRGDRSRDGSFKKVPRARQVRRKRHRQPKSFTADNISAGTDGSEDLSREKALDAELKAFAELVALSPRERKLRGQVFQDVRDLISSTFQDATVQLYGSSSTGLDTFRSDLDITVGNITLPTSQRLQIPVIDDEDEVPDQQEETQADTAEAEEVETSFSLNLALPMGTAVSQENADITRRVLPTPKSHWNPALRRRKIRTLRALQSVLKSQRPHFQVKCLHKAKTPILMVLDTKNKLSIDVGVNREVFEASEHGQSTALVLRLQKTLGAPFTTMVMFLKEFLHQFDIDKPFTGGLGSFRLYVMIAFVFQRCSKHKGKQEPVSILLLRFFELFGNKKTPNFLTEDTQLPLPFESGNCMDFGGVFRITDCVETFAMAFDILNSSWNLGSIIFEERLQQDRKKSLKEVQQ